MTEEAISAGCADYSKRAYCSYPLSMNPSVLPASCRQNHRCKALPARCRQHLCGGVSPVAGSWSQSTAKPTKLSMNLKTHTLILKGLRVSGSWSQCIRKSERGLSMNRNFQIRITNDEIRRNTEIRMMKPPSALRRVVRPSSFGFLASFVIRHSSFVIRHSSFVIQFMFTNL